MKSTKQDILKGNGEKIVELATKVGKYLNQGGRRERLSSSQIRNFFGEVSRISLRQLNAEDLAKKVHLLRPKLAYATARQRESVGKLYNVLDPLLADLGKSGEEILQQFPNFLSFFEAVLAYFKLYGGN